jgi:hypothetical protein
MRRVPVPYRDRLRLEGAVLAACGAAGSAGLLLLVEASRERPVSTVLQLAGVALLLLVLAPRVVRAWADAAEDVRPEGHTGEPTPLWHLPLVCAGLAAIFAVPGVWDAALRVTGGCLLVGLAQALLLPPVVARVERERRGTLIRLPGSRVLRGTRLGLVRRPAP